MASTPLIHLESVSYQLGTQVIVRDVTLAVKEHQVISLLWYNGSWKSTLLKLLLGSLMPSRWQIVRKQWLKIWYVPQKLSFVQHIPFTVKDFLSVYNSSSQIHHPFSCSLLDIAWLLDKPLNGLSWGQVQAVLLYNALIGNPDVLLLDEPTAWLDIRAQEEFYALLDHLHEQHGMSLVIVSHDMHTVYSKSDLVVCLHQGVCCTGSPHDSWFSTHIQTLFGSHVLPYLHTHMHDR